MSSTDISDNPLPSDPPEWLARDKQFAEARKNNLAAILKWKEAGGYWPPGGKPSHPDEWKLVEQTEQDRAQLDKRANPDNFHDLFDRMDREDPEAIESAIAWLETDPFVRSSGYYKEKIMLRLCRMPMTTEQKGRIRKLLLRLITRGPRQDFKYSCRLARHVDNEEFRSILRGFSKRPEPQIVSGAKRMLAACETKGAHKK